MKYKIEVLKKANNVQTQDSLTLKKNFQKKSQNT